MRKYWRAETGLFLGLWLLLMIGGRSRLFRDPGTFWHTVMGQRMLSSWRLIDADPFSFTFGGSPWVPYEWLAEIVMAIVHRIGGLDGLLLATVTTLASLFTWAAHRLIRTGLHWLPTTLLVVLTIAASATHFHARPHIASIAFFGITCASLGDLESGRIRLGRLFWLVPLYVFWTNWHGAMLGGLATLGFAAVGWCIAAGIGRDSPIVRPRQAIALWLLVLVCGLTALANPYGLRLPMTWLEIMRSPVVSRIIEEHAPPNPHSIDFWMILSLGLVYGVVFHSTLPRWPRVTWLIPFIWFALTLSRIRHAPLFAIAALVAMADMLPYTRLAAWLARPGRDLFRFATPDVSTRDRRDWRPAAIPLVLILCAVVLQAAGVRAPVLGRGWARLDPAVWPVELLPELRRCEREHPSGSRVFNDYVLGGFLIYFTPDLKVFIDDRCEVYGDAWLERFAYAVKSDPGLMDEWLEQYHIEYALVISGSGFDRHLANRSDWSLVRQTRPASLYRRDFR
jgi:hypothetical protein